MSRRDPAVRLRHVRDHAREALELSAGRARDEVEHDRVLTLALVRLLEIVGEAAGRVPPETRAQLSDVPWPRIIGLRNRLIHEYDAVDFDVLWSILTVWLAPLVTELDAYLGDATP